MIGPVDHWSPIGRWSTARLVVPLSRAGWVPQTISGVGGRLSVDAVMRRENERGRLAVDGRRTDDARVCTLVVHEVGSRWALYPHGAGRLGVRREKAEAVRVGAAILAGVQ